MFASPADLPVLRCPKRPLGAVLADPALAPWPQLAAVALRETVSGKPPGQATWIKAAWSEHELRVLFWVEDTQVWATLTEHNAPLYEEEVVEVFLDPAGDSEKYFEIEVNPLNTVLEVALLREGSGGWRKDFQWRCAGLRTAVQRHPAGWCAEFSLPFAGLRVATPTGKRWRANFYRIDRPPGAPRELSAWSPTGEPNFHVPARFGDLEFVP